MNLAQLTALVAEGESERLEFKKSTGELRAGMETLCAFLNGNGGKLLFGVTDGQRVLGQEISDKTLRDVAQEIIKLEPSATVSQMRIPIVDNKEVLLIETTVRSSAPYAFNGRPYRRIGTTTSVMPQDEYERLLLQRGHSQHRWESQIAEGYSIRDLDEAEIRKTIQESIDAGRLESTDTGPVEALGKLELVVDDRLTRAAMVVFALHPSRDFPQCALRMARFRGDNKDEFLDGRQLTGHAFTLLRESDLFMKRHLPVASRIVEGQMERVDEPLFPPIALREAMVNALCHRDYSIVGGAISLAIYDDRLEITSTGGLPFGLTAADLTREHNSRPRNPLIAEVFYRRGLIERWGRGTLKIIELCRNAGHPEPEFEERGGDVVVRFLASEYVPPGKVNHELTDRQREILQVLSDGKQWMAGDVCRQFDPPLASATLREDLTLLRSLGLVGSGGYGRGAKWWLTNKPE